MPGIFFVPCLTMLCFHRLWSVICEKTFHITNVMTQLHSYLPKMAGESEYNEDKKRKYSVKETQACDSALPGKMTP